MPVDELRARRALRRLDQHRQKHPEAFDLDLDRLPSRPAKLAAALGERSRIGRPPSEDPKLVVPIRMSRTMVDAVDAAVAAREPKITRQEAVREAIERWLRAERRRQ